MKGRLEQQRVAWSDQAALGVVLASGGYPGHYEKGKRIAGLDRPVEAGVKIFHAGTRLQQGDYLTDGGRVLCVTALGDGVGEAQARAYRAASPVSFEGAQYRSDIGHRAIGR